MHVWGIKEPYINCIVLSNPDNSYGLWVTERNTLCAPHNLSYSSVIGGGGWVAMLNKAIQFEIRAGFMVT